MKIGDKIVWFNSADSPDEIREGTITKLRVDRDLTLVWMDGKHKSEDCLYASYAWPACVKNELIEILTKRSKLKEAFDNSMGLLYELRNAITRGEKG